ncbi:XrtA/PEP-CTERM system-associated ATPase [Altererythrobacter sp. H2]|uniref:XrtA/PEP-CTERM system-associated ATPase n=1 Tax=Altererythrobacter sp. H2 TaxID=3108391 RepID=UPI002B4BC604|nr:XrtA/PEP-CTERM system-associated ATPase [Altererythrobacter sp. H2]WRK94757.1 XrtA/PEP-CTERM system-associated ATPase [Altererythrobacter sp. H2]
MFDDFYGLTGRPFQLTPDPNFFFESGTHRKALSYLGYGLAQSEGFIVITGEVGAGKSTLVAHLMQRIDRERITVGQIVTSNLDGGELVHLAAQSFGLDIEGHDKASALGEIENFLHEEAREGRRCLLIVDESQNLSVEALEELRMLSNFQLGAHPLLQVLLLGQPEFKKVLAEHQSLEQLRQRVIAAHHLEPMEPGELEPYIRHRLACVGWKGNPEFDQRVFAEMYQATGGIPRRINQVATRLLLLGAVEQRTRIDAAMLSAVLKEMRSDNAFPEAAPSPMPRIDHAPAPGPVKHAAYQQPAEAPAALSVDIEAALAQRDAQVAELQQAVLELSRRVGDGQPPADVMQRMAALEHRLEDQERTVRHVLTMLIEWVETGQPPRAVA